MVDVDYSGLIPEEDAQSILAKIMGEKNDKLNSMARRMGINTDDPVKQLHDKGELRRSGNVKYEQSTDDIGHYEGFDLLPEDDPSMKPTNNESRNTNDRVVNSAVTGVANPIRPVQNNEATAAQGINTATNDHAEPPKVNNDDPKIKEQRKKLLEEAHTDLYENLIGLEDVKKNMNALESTIRADEDRRKYGLVPEGKDTKMAHHLVLIGPPGTGKTTVARDYGKILSGLGILNGFTGEVIETDRSGMVAGYAGQTAVMTNARCNEAISKGCPLFIDEAYLLKNGKDDSFGDEAISTLLRRMENDRDDLVVIVAGYPKEMEAFLNANTGLRSRFAAKIEFKDYSDDELVEIVKIYARSRSLHISDDVCEAFKDSFVKLRRTDAFANARTARVVFDNAVQAQSIRYSNSLNELGDKMTDDERKDILQNLSVEDVKAGAVEALEIAEKDTTSKAAYGADEDDDDKGNANDDFITGLLSHAFSTAAEKAQRNVEQAESNSPEDASTSTSAASKPESVTLNNETSPKKPTEDTCKKTAGKSK